MDELRGEYTMTMQVETRVPIRMKEIPMDLTDPYYAQFWPDGEIPAQRARDVGLHDLHGVPGAVGTFRSHVPTHQTPRLWDAKVTIPSCEMASAVRNYRRHHRLMKVQLAERLDVSPTVVGAIENERYSQTRLSTAERWAQRLGLTLDQFLAFANHS